MNDESLILVSHYVPDEFLGELFEFGKVVIGPPTTESDGLSQEMWELLPEAGRHFLRFYPSK